EDCLGGLPALLHRFAVAFEKDAHAVGGRVGQITGPGREVECGTRVHANHGFASRIFDEKIASAFFLRAVAETHGPPGMVESRLAPVPRTVVTDPTTRERCIDRLTRKMHMADDPYGLALANVLDGHGRSSSGGTSRSACHG